MENILRILTSGSVDDGKSTLIGRLLFDSKQIFKDQLQSVEDASKKRGRNEIDLALLTDGLRAEREQGITIDVAYRYFSTPKRKFIIADCPGHVEYTRNMVTGASTCNAGILLINATKGVLEQTKRHLFIMQLLNIKHIIICVNMMDLINWEENIFHEIVNKCKKFINDDIEYKFLPISAKLGDNIINKSENMSWYNGKTLINILESINIENYTNDYIRLPIQTVIRPSLSFRGYAGRLSGGSLNKGDKVIVYPTLEESIITDIIYNNIHVNNVNDGNSILITLSDNISISRGDIITTDKSKPMKQSNNINCTICWFSHNGLFLNKKYLLRTNTGEYNCKINVKNILDIETLEFTKNFTENEAIRMNNIFRGNIISNKLISYDDYKYNNVTGSFIIIDCNTNNTVGAGVFEDDRK